MGYTTEFDGQFKCDPPLSEAHANYLRDFAATRRMKRDAAIAEKLDPPDSTRRAAGLPIGDDGAYFAQGGSDGYGQDKDDSILHYNGPPAGQPGLWCHWVPTGDGTAIEWDGGEKFYSYVEWLKYLIEHFLKPWGYTLSGDVAWQGEDSSDSGTIRVADNVVLVAHNKIVPGPFAPA